MSRGVRQRSSKGGPRNIKYSPGRHPFNDNRNHSVCIISKWNVGLLTRGLRCEILFAANRRAGIAH